MSSADIRLVGLRQRALSIQYKLMLRKRMLQEGRRLQKQNSEEHRGVGYHMEAVRVTLVRPG
jgi:hypothetical protein